MTNLSIETIVPTPTNFLNYATDVISASIRRGATATLVLPPLKERAYTLVGELGTMAVQAQLEDTVNNFDRE